jgi:hypothetical protein
MGGRWIESGNIKAVPIHVLGRQFLQANGLDYPTMANL